MKAKDLAEIIESAAPGSIEGDEYGLIQGDAGQIITKIGIIWRLSINLLKKIIEDNVNLLIVHESIYLTEYDSKWSINVKDYAIHYNKCINEMIKDNNITVYRYHTNIDLWPGIGILDSFAKQLGLMKEVSKGKFTRTYNVPPISIEEVSELVANCFPRCPIRIFGDKSRIITRISTMIGGLGGNQLLMPYEIKEQGGEVIILGDMIEYTILKALELDIAVIETLHSVTEEPGLYNMKKYLDDKLPEMKINFYESGSYLYC